MEIIYFALGLVTALVLAEVVAWFSVVKTFNRYSEKITNIQMQNTKLIQSTKEEVQLLNIRIDDLQDRLYKIFQKFYFDFLNLCLYLDQKLLFLQHHL